MVMMNWADYGPDQAILNGSFSGDIKNVLRAAQSYIPFKSLEELTEALPDKPLAGFMARSLSGQVSVFAGTATKLYKLNNTSLAWDDVSQTLTTYSASSTAKWSFEQFGEYVVAVNLNDDPQRFLLDTDTEFSTLAGSPPRANVVRACGGFLFLHQLADNPSRSQWSGLENIEHWTPGSQNSDFQDFPDGGVVQGSTSTTNPIIFLERAIYLGQFIPGSAEIFAFQKVHDKRGAKSPYSIASRGSLAFYADEGGFFQIDPSGVITPIGYERVDRTIFENLAVSDIANIQGAVDPFHNRVYWAIDDDSDGYFDRILVYDWNLQKWSPPLDVDISIMLPAATLGYTLEGLDSFGSLDDLPFSLDSKVWQGGAPVIAAFPRSHVMGFFSGPAMEATLVTQETGDVKTVVRVTETVPVVDADDLSEVFVSLGARMRRSDDFVWSEEVTPSTNTGIARKRSRARFHKVQVRIAAGASWEHAQGVDCNPSPAGQR